MLKLDRLTHQVGVLVQGPPGTGKSHTIANLICHLLATGKRILVTSQKAPALRVLKEKLPREVANLCVMVLGEGADEQQELRNSVENMANRYTNWSLHQSKHRIENLRTELTHARTEEAKAFETLCAVREKETFRHPKLFDRYEGTLGEIAVQVRQDAEKFTWFNFRLPDSISLITQSTPPLPVEQANVKRLLELLRQIDPEEEARADEYLISLNDVPSAEEFRAMVDAEEKAKRDFEERQYYLDHPAHDVLSDRSTIELRELLHALEDFLGRLRSAMNEDSGWEWQTAEDILHGNALTFKAIQETSRELLTNIEKEIRETADLEVAGLEEKSPRVVLQDAIELKTHLEQGGRWGFWVFRPDVVKQCLYLKRELTVDGRCCDSVNSLDRLIRWLQFHESIKKLREQWNGIAIIDIELESAKFACCQQNFLVTVPLLL
jgi:hypothetical protein